MRKIIVIVTLIYSFGISAIAQTVKFSGNTHSVYEEVPEKSTGLDKIYVLYNTAGVSVSYEAVNDAEMVKWYKYGTQGGGFAEEITGITKSGKVSTLSQVLPNSGYIIEDGSVRTYFWVVNYADYYLTLSSIAPLAEQDCGTIGLGVSGNGDDISFTTINGVRKKISRDIILTFNTLEWDSEGKQWDLKQVEKRHEGFKAVIYETAPLCDTEFSLVGDRFLKYWGEEKSLVSSTYKTHAIEIQTIAEQAERDVSNEKNEEGQSTLGGSAPVDITFSAYPTDAVAQREWQLSTDPEFGTVERSFTEDIYQETFNDAGTLYVRYIAKNIDGTCEAESETYVISIGESSLICPNAFSPQGSPGVNDEWRVQYKSIVSFKCWIFNKWGTQICELKDPSQGWDGKYKGKYVGPGVYYYVIQAKGADGKDYKLKGDINIINYKGRESTGNNGEGVVE
jgi:gliding motility-associated-like protein